MTKTFYDVLGVSADASTAEIRAAYRERLKESHPDLSDDDDANATTRRIIRARDVLTDEDERERYDRVGHAEFVGNTDSAVDEDDVSNAAAAARNAGWANDGADGSESTAADDARTRSRAEGRRRARNRRRRERAAQERVESEHTDGTNEKAQGTTTASTDGGAAATGSTSPGGVSESARSWNGSGGYSVRQRRHTGLGRSRLLPRGKSLTMLPVAFVLYPLLLFSALFPPFPLFVNLVVGLCAIFLVGYLQSRPEVGVIVFGIWSLITPVAFVTVGVPLTGLVGIVGLTGTWLPLGLSVLTLGLVQP